MKLQTVNPLTRAVTESERITVREGTRIAFNPARRNLPTLVTGSVVGIGWSERNGRLVTIRPDFAPHCKLTGIAIDRITVKVLSH
jgi:hypothetical protein